MGTRERESYRYVKSIQKAHHQTHYMDNGGMFRVPLASSGLRPKDIERMNETLLSANFTMGSKVKDFENKMASYLGFQNFVMVNSGSSANLAVFEALLRPVHGDSILRVGDEVLVPAISWPTTIWPIIQLGLKPIFVDVESDSMAMDLSEAEDLLEGTQNKVRAIFPIHPLGYAINQDLIIEFAKKFNLVYLSDTCEALGAFRNGYHAGKGSIAASFSFYFSHHMTTMEGGGIATDDFSLADDLRSIRSHGWSRDRSDSSSWTQGVKEVDEKFTFVSTGFNIRPMEIQGAIGLSQLEDLPSFISRRREIASTVKEAIEETPLQMLEGDASDTLHDSQHSRMLIALRLPKGEYLADCRKLLKSQGIETRPPLTGNFLAQPAAARVLGHRFNPRNYKVANSITSSTFLVGCHHDYTDSQVEYLCEKLVGVFR